MAQTELYYRGRAAAYVDALQAVQERIQARTPALYRLWFKRWETRLPAVNARIHAYGSLAARDAYVEVLGVILSESNGVSGTPKLRRFATIVNRELTGTSEGTWPSGRGKSVDNE